jgi:hypothetical protein
MTQNGSREPSVAAHKTCTELEALLTSVCRLNPARFRVQAFGNSLHVLRAKNTRWDYYPGIPLRPAATRTCLRNALTILAHVPLTLQPSK